MARPKDVASVIRQKSQRPDEYFTFGDPGEAPAPPSGEVTRIAGGDRYEAASDAFLAERLAASHSSALPAR